MVRFTQTIVFIVLTSISSNAQNFVTETGHFRDRYKKGFLTTKGSPLKEKDLNNLRFYEADSTYRVVANFSRTPESIPFKMLTSAGTRQDYVQYGLFSFQLQGSTYTLPVYASLSLRTIPQYRDYLFLPFKDLSNGNETYGAGRYIDMKTGDISPDNTCVIDFNRAYNPYCAYGSGYQCPIPPKANTLTIAIRAGEKNYVKNYSGD
jgi:uncharacterized protein